MKTERELKNGEVNMARRSFLRYAGAGVAGIGIIGVAASCSKDHLVNPGAGIDVGPGDGGILNYAYALEQLEAAFYIQVVKTPYSGIAAAELADLTEIRDHEVAHREFFKAALGKGAIPALTVDFSSIDFTSRASVLAAAKTFEDLGVTAYDGVGALITNTDYLTVAGKIVSVEARHAAYIANLLGSSFVPSDQVDANGLNITNKPSTVLAAANTYLKTKVSARSFS
jgi:hypothetical protein